MRDRATPSPAAFSRRSRSPDATGGITLVCARIVDERCANSPSATQTAPDPMRSLPFLAAAMTVAAVPTKANAALLGRARPSDHRRGRRCEPPRRDAEVLPGDAGGGRACGDRHAGGARPSGVGAEVLEARRGTASAQLARSVAALENIRLDLLRLHANAGDLAPLTTLIDAARLLGVDVNRLADATREATRAAASRLPAARRVPTPA